MVFVYPCVTSENVNRQIVPAATKSMEIFFLYQLQSAFNDGVIRCVQNPDYANLPGPITFECTDKSNGKETLLEKSFDALENIKMIVTEDKVYYKNDYTKPRMSDDIKNIITESQNVEEKLHTFKIKLDYMVENSTNKDFIKSAKLVTENIVKDIKTEHEFRKLLEAKGPDVPRENDKNGTPIEISQDGGKKGKDQKADNFKKSDDIKIDLTPTSMPLEVQVYRKNKDGRTTTENKLITVGVKVVPIKIKNFNMVNDALMNDYFTKFSEGVFKSIYRSAARGIMGGFRKVLDKIGISKFLPDPADEMYKRKGDIVKQMITMAPSNFVNASAFRSNLHSAPANYKFTSSVVMFNKDDIEEDESIFMNRSAMNRLFKMGWTSFAVLDPVKEVMLFISNLDGGFLHELPYSYMFNALNASDIYKNESSLRNGARPFSIRKGNFAAFARSL